ncbi:hypothetical protein BaRGS_00007988 [Batillaria attramentaria]|uniref:Uncharacterized protein n=1 Tax=Batillaria attramentaria TaxID=370345 RepID=A0ABD0LMS2_9CAEN
MEGKPRPLSFVELNIRCVGRLLWSDDCPLVIVPSVWFVDTPWAIFITDRKVGPPGGTSRAGHALSSSRGVPGRASSKICPRLPTKVQNENAARSCQFSDSHLHNSHALCADRLPRTGKNVSAACSSSEHSACLADVFTEASEKWHLKPPGTDDHQPPTLQCLSGGFFPFLHAAPFIRQLTRRWTSNRLNTRPPGTTHPPRHTHASLPCPRALHRKRRALTDGACCQGNRHAAPRGGKY